MEAHESVEEPFFDPSSKQPLYESMLGEAIAVLPAVAPHAVSFRKVLQIIRGALVFKGDRRKEADELLLDVASLLLAGISYQGAWWQLHPIPEKRLYGVRMRYILRCSAFQEMIDKMKDE